MAPGSGSRLVAIDFFLSRKRLECANFNEGTMAMLGMISNMEKLSFFRRLYF